MYLFIFTIVDTYLYIANYNLSYQQSCEVLMSLTLRNNKTIPPFIFTYLFGLFSLVNFEAIGVGLASCLYKTASTFVSTYARKYHIHLHTQNPE